MELGYLKLKDFCSLQAMQGWPIGGTYLSWTLWLPGNAFLASHRQCNFLSVKRGARSLATGAKKQCRIETGNGIRPTGERTSRSASQRCGAQQEGIT